MRNIDYYGTELFLKGMEEENRCLFALVHETKNKTDHFCSDHNNDCKSCKEEAMQWLNEPFKRITEKEHQFLSMLNSKIKYINFLDNHNRIIFENENGEEIYGMNWNIIFDERPFSTFDNETDLSVEELLKLEVA